MGLNILLIGVVKSRCVYRQSDNIVLSISIHEEGRVWKRDGRGCAHASGRSGFDRCNGLSIFVHFAHCVPPHFLRYYVLVLLCCMRALALRCLLFPERKRGGKQVRVGKWKTTHLCGSSISMWRITNSNRLPIRQLIERGIDMMESKTSATKVKKEVSALVRSLRDKNTIFAMPTPILRTMVIAIRAVAKRSRENMPAAFAAAADWRW